MGGDDNAQILENSVEVLWGYMHYPQQGRDDEDSGEDRKHKIESHGRRCVGAIVPIGSRHGVTTDSQPEGETSF